MNEDKIDVSDLAPRDLLQGLYLASRPQGMGFLHAKDGPLPDDELEQLTAELPQYFNYLHGRVMKVEINGEVLDPRLYDRDNGLGAAQSVVDAVRRGSKV